MLFFQFAFPSKLWFVAMWALMLGLTGCALTSRGELRLVAAPEALAQNNLRHRGASTVTDQPQLEVHRLEHSEVYLLRLPATVPFIIEPVVSDSLEKLPNLAKQQVGQAGTVIAAINGGFFDPKNQQTASHVIRNGEVLLDPNQNLDLISNRNVASYMSQILNRSEFRRYQCGLTPAGLPKVLYGIAFHDGLVPPGCDRLDALGAGPQLLPTMTHQQEAFWDVVDGKTLRNPIGMNSRNARSAIAITADGGLLLAMAAQLPPPLTSSSSSAEPSVNPGPTTTSRQGNISVIKPPVRTGITLTEMADFLQEQGAVQALNLDGGSSSALFYKQQTHYGRLDREGQPIQRSIKSALVVKLPLATH